MKLSYCLVQALEVYAFGYPDVERACQFMSRMYLGLTHRLRSRMRSREHLLRLAQQLIAKLAWGATKTSRDTLVRPSNLAVVDLAP
jgi:hypothetical protein